MGILGVHPDSDRQGQASRAVSSRIFQRSEPAAVDRHLTTTSEAVNSRFIVRRSLAGSWSTSPPAQPNAFEAPQQRWPGESAERPVDLQVAIVMVWCEANERVGPQEAPKRWLKLLLWRVACTSGSLNGLIAAARAGLGVMAHSRGMVPPGLVRVPERAGLPGAGRGRLRAGPRPPRPSAQSAADALAAAILSGRGPAAPADAPSLGHRGVVDQCAPKPRESAPRGLVRAASGSVRIRWRLRGRNPLPP